MNTSGLSRVAGRTALKLRKNSPTILFAAGITGSVATVVLACRATLKARDVHQQHKSAVRIADTRHDSGVYDDQSYKQAVVAAWASASGEYVKLFGPSFVLGVTSIAFLTKSHLILKERNAGLMAAYAGLDTMFKQYRSRVVEEYGIEKDTELAHGKAEDGVHTEYDKKGNAVVKETKKAPKDATTAYGRFFDEQNRHWDKDPGYNHTFLDNQQKWANLQLKSKGFLFLNDVYELIGLPKTAAGQQVGWYYDNENGDQYVDFGFNRYPDFVAGYERSVFLDFNVDGPILHFIE